MNQLTKTALVAVGAALASGAAQAANNLVLGFNGNGAGSDYVINLGNYQTSVGVNGSAVVDLSSYFNLTTFNGNFINAQNPTADGVNMGGGGGTVGLSPAVFLTELRLGGAGIAAVAGSTLPLNQTPSDASTTAGFFTAVLGNTGNYPALGQQGGGALVLGSDPASWTSQITANSGQSLLALEGINDVSPINGGVLYEDLYQGTKSGASEMYAYKGYFTLDLTGSSPVLDFTPASVVPEPSACFLLGAGFLLVIQRARSNRKPA